MHDWARPPPWAARHRTQCGVGRPELAVTVTPLCVRQLVIAAHPHATRDTAGDSFASKAMATRCQTQRDTIYGCPPTHSSVRTSLHQVTLRRAASTPGLRCLAPCAQGTSDHQRFDSWRKQRYAVAHRVGTLLPKHIHRPLSQGDQQFTTSISLVPVSAMWAGPGQAQEAKRRLRALPIGESHHSAVTVPPELWTRVIVVSEQSCSRRR
jgi:hypothetical protein